MNRTLITGALLVWLGLCTNADGHTGRYRAMWRTDPSTSMVIGWQQFSGTDARILYQPDDGGVERWIVHYPDRCTEIRDMPTCFARLTGLRPDTRYRFVVRDNEGDSRVLYFHTAPANSDTPVTLLCGGDSRNNRSMRQRMNLLAARMQPLAILFSGDMTDWSTVREWQEWLDDWQLTITLDGRLIPIIPARGNHEPSNDLLTDLFDVPHPEVWYSLGFGGDLLRVYTLNSMAPATGKQAEWLEHDLSVFGPAYTWRMVQYHHPIRPHQKRKRPQHAQYAAWADLFYRHNVQLVQESDAHVVKVTWPLRPDTGPGSREGFIRDDNAGTIYLGEGGWGAPLRKADDLKPWTRQAGSFNQFNWIRVSRDRMEIRIIDADASSHAVALASLSYGERPAGIRSWPIGGKESLVLTPRQKADLAIFTLEKGPLPAVRLDGKSSLEIPVRLATGSEVEIRLLNMRRQIVFSEVRESQAGLYFHQVATHRIPAGRHLLEVLANGTPIFRRLVEK